MITCRCRTSRVSKDSEYIIVNAGPIDVISASPSVTVFVLALAQAAGAVQQHSPRLEVAKPVGDEARLQVVQKTLLSSG